MQVVWSGELSGGVDMKNEEDDPVTGTLISYLLATIWLNELRSGLRFIRRSMLVLFSLFYPKNFRNSVVRVEKVKKNC